MLGTNDARTDNFQSIENFSTDYIILINQIKNIESNPIILLIKPPPLFNNDLDLISENLSMEIIPRIEQLADQFGFGLIDVYSVLVSHQEYFPDGLHPNNEGAYIIADEVYKTIIQIDFDRVGFFR